MSPANLPSSPGRVFETLWICCTNRGLNVLPLSRTDLSYGLCDGYAKGGVAVQHRNPDLDLSDL